MWELVKAGGWLMLPIVICSVLMCAIAFDRVRTLSIGKNAPQGLAEQLLSQAQAGSLSDAKLEVVAHGSALGDVLASGLLVRNMGMDAMALQMQNRAGYQTHKLEKNVNMLGTIGAIAPLLGLLGTVLGIINSFLAITDGAMQDPTLLAAGVSQALITTAAGMMVAIPALILHRYFQRRIVDINAIFEEEAGVLIKGLLIQEKEYQAKQNQAMQSGKESPIQDKVV